MSKPALPPKVAAAISAVMKGVKRLEKGEHNKHGGYDFTSVDGFLEATRPLCGAAGLIIVPDEEDASLVDKWLKVKFSFTVAHESGETWEHSPTRTVMVNSAMGSQAYGAAQSYALKQFLRALFQIATGDGEDADSHPNEQLPGPRKAPPPAPPRPDAEAMRYAAEAETFALNVDDANELMSWWNSDEQKQRRRAVNIPPDVLAKLKETVASRANALSNRGMNGSH
jgi:hypothetical protein